VHGTWKESYPLGAGVEVASGSKTLGSLHLPLMISNFFCKVKLIVDTSVKFQFVELLGVYV